MAVVRRPYLGGHMAQKVSGSGPFTAYVGGGTNQLNFPIFRAVPLDPLNLEYPPVLTGSGFPAVEFQGKASPVASIETFVKPRNAGGTNGWFNADVLNSLVMSLDSDNNTDLWDLGFKDDTASVEVWASSRCQQITFRMPNAMGGPIFCDLDFVSRFVKNGERTNYFGQTIGDENETIRAAPTFYTPYIDYGQGADISTVNFGGVFTQVKAWILTLYRVQSHIGYADTTLIPRDVCSGPMTGTLIIEQSAAAGAYIGGSGSLNLVLCNDKGITTGKTQIALKLKMMDRRYIRETGYGTIIRPYNLIDLSTGGNPAAITAVS